MQQKLIVVQMSMLLVVSSARITYAIVRIYSVQNVAKTIVCDVDFCATKVHYKIQCNKIDSELMNIWRCKYALIELILHYVVPR